MAKDTASPADRANVLWGRSLRLFIKRAKAGGVTAVSFSPSVSVVLVALVLCGSTGACTADCKTVLSFWAPVEANPKYYGEIILLRLFETHPDVQKLFPKFAELSKEQLQNNPGVQAHGEIVVCKLTEILKGEPEEVVKALAETHAKQHKIPLVNFQIISEVIVMVAAEKLDGFGLDAQTALKNVLKQFQIRMGACYEELGFNK
ncbi:myoglobin-like [Polypterus senegalus]|uniref:myoglobin-like n=1 Tax=Polypterus senegalus TaxID=55291 RepID=UPI0019636A06|nr:myoglobin-like [Polypterus senegalus]